MNDNHANMDRNVNMSQNDGGIAQPVWAGDGDGDYSEDSVFSLDFAAIWAAIYRSRFWIAGIVVGLLLIGFVITILSTPIFRATSTVQSDQEAATVLGTTAINAPAAIQDSERFLTTPTQRIRTRSPAHTVAKAPTPPNQPDFSASININH